MADEATQETGADETSVDTSNTAATESATDAGGNDGEAALGDAGKKALDRMKADKRAAEQRARELEQRLAELEARENGREAEFEAAQEAQKVKDEALALANDRIKKAEIRAAAKGKVADEALADLPVLMADALSEIEVGSDGEVDASQIARAINDLIASKPYLAAQGSRFQGSADGGARKDDTKVAQLTRSDMERMTPEQIVEARAKGQFNDLLSGR